MTKPTDAPRFKCCACSHITHKLACPKCSHRICMRCKPVAKGERNAKGNPVSAAPAGNQLSQRELQIMLLFVAGQRVTAISKHLGISVKTVSTHKARSAAKLSVPGASDVLLAHAARLHIDSLTGSPATPSTGATGSAPALGVPGFSGGG